jgi:hypothetical protein
MEQMVLLVSQYRRSPPLTRYSPYDSVAVVKEWYMMGVNLRPVGLSQELDTCHKLQHVSHASFTLVLRTSHLGQR